MKKSKQLTGIRGFLDKKNLIMYSISYYNLFRGLTKWIRINPTFIIIGAGRSGTTALCDYLTKNKDGFEASTKELHFFDEYFDKGIKWYRGNFPTIFHKFYLENILHRKIIAGEATAAYLHNPLVAKRVASTIPDVKLIVILRNPVDRAHSHYRRRFERGGENNSFENVMEKGLTYLQQKKDKEVLDKVPQQYLSHSYISRGLYYEQLKIWTKYFPKSQIFLIKSEDFFDDPLSVLHKVYKFLGKKNINLKNISNLKINKNIGGYNVKLDQNLRRKLTNFYKPHNEKLNKFWNVDFSWE